MSIEQKKSHCCHSGFREQFWGTSKVYRCNRCNKRCSIGDPKNIGKVTIPYYGHAQIVNFYKKD